MSRKKSRERWEYLDKLHSTDIKVFLLKHGITQRQIAKELGLHYSAISLYISNTKSSKRFDDWLFNKLREKGEDNLIFRLFMGHLPDDYLEEYFNKHPEFREEIEKLLNQPPHPNNPIFLASEKEAA